MLLMTHDPDLVMAADRVVALRDGRVAARGTPAELAAAGVLSPTISLSGPARPPEGGR